MWSLLGAVQLDTDAQLEAETQVKKLEELRLEKDVCAHWSASSGLGTQVGEQIGELETWACDKTWLGS